MITKQQVDDFKKETDRLWTKYTDKCRDLDRLAYRWIKEARNAGDENEAKDRFRHCYFKLWISLDALRMAMDLPDNESVHCAYGPGELDVECPRCNQKAVVYNRDELTKIVEDPDSFYCFLCEGEIMDEMSRARDLPYERYLSTPHWRKVRDAALERARNRCSVCDSSEPLVVHHRSYLCLGHEHQSDVVALCKKCHGKAHAGNAYERY